MAGETLGVFFFPIFSGASQPIPHPEPHFTPATILVLEKPEVSGHQIWDAEGLSHLGDLMFSQKTLHKTRCIVVMKLPITSCPELWPSESSE